MFITPILGLPQADPPIVDEDPINNPPDDDDYQPDEKDEPGDDNIDPEDPERINYGTPVTIASGPTDPWIPETEADDPIPHPFTEMEYVEPLASSAEAHELARKPFTIGKMEFDKPLLVNPMESSSWSPSSDYASYEFIHSLNEIHDEIDKDDFFQTGIVGTTAIVTGSLSVGYVIWMIRGGILMSTVLSALPAWKMIDPLPILAADNDDDSEEDDSLESMVSKSNNQNPVVTMA